MTPKKWMLLGGGGLAVLLALCVWNSDRGREPLTRTFSFSTQGENPILAASIWAGGKAAAVPSGQLDQLLEQISAVTFTPTSPEYAQAPGAGSLQVTLARQDGALEIISFECCLYDGTWYAAPSGSGDFLLDYFPPNTWWEYSQPSPTFDFSTNETRPPVIRVWARANDVWTELPAEQIPDFLALIDTVVFTSRTSEHQAEVLRVTIRFQDGGEQSVTFPDFQGHTASLEDIQPLLEFLSEQ